MMKIKIASTSTRTSKAAGKYTYAKGSILKKDGSVRENVTFMAFGKQRESLVKRLRKGAELEVNAVFEGGTVKLLGLYEPKPAAEPVADAA